MIELDLAVPVEICVIFEHFIRLGNTHTTNFEIVNRIEDVDTESNRYFVYSIQCHALEEQESKQRIESYFDAMICGMLFSHRFHNPSSPKTRSRDRFVDIALRIL